MTERGGIAGHVLRRVGPGFITAAIVLGPGSILASSRAGAEASYNLVWILVLSAVFMAAFTAMGARLGCVLDESPLSFAAARWGRWAAVVVGLSGFLVATGFQFGNNIGVAVALGGLLPLPAWLWPPLFTGMALLFLASARHFYALLEKVMLGFVLLMLGAFLGNLLITGFSPTALVAGLVPRTPGDGELVIGRAMLATTFSAVAAFYQAYLVRAKGWGRQQLSTAIADAWLGIALLTLIGLIIMVTAAAALGGRAGDFDNIAELADLFGSVLGPWSTVVFCLGLAAAACSSIIANVLVGGVLMADGLGLGHRVDSPGTRACAAVSLVIGCLVAMAILLGQTAGTTSVLIAQSATLFAAPLCALMLFGVTTSKRIMGDLRNGPVMIAVGLAGLGVIAWLNGTLLMRLVGQ